MIAFKCAITGDTQPKTAAYPIEANTTVLQGQVVALDISDHEGYVSPVAADRTAAVLGVAAQTHTGSYTVYPADTSDEILVWDNPAQVYATAAPVITATGGTATTIIDTAVDAFADDDFIGGWVKLISKAANSTITDPVGTVKKITDYTANTNTFETGSWGGNVTAGDKFLLFPPIGLAKGGLGSGVDSYSVADDDTTIAKIYGHDIKSGTVYLTLKTVHE